MAGYTLEELTKLGATPVMKRYTLDELKAAGATPMVPDTPDEADATVGGAVQGITAGFFDDLAGLLGQGAVGGGVNLGKGAEPSPDDAPEVAAAKRLARAEVEAMPTRRENLRDAVREKLDAAQAAHPNYFAGGRVGGALLTAPFVAKALPASMGLLGSMGAGAGLGGLNALGESRADILRGEGWQALQDTGKGALLGGATGGLGYGMTNALTGAVPALGASMLSGGLLSGGMAALDSDKETFGGKMEDVVVPFLLGATGAGAGYGLARATGAGARGSVRGFVKPTEEAQHLREQGLPLTVGQMNPRSALGQAEDVGTSAAIVGPRLQEQRAALPKAFEQAALSRAPPKAGSFLVKGLPQEQLADSYRQIGERYDQVRDSPLSPRAQARPVNATRVGKAFEKAATDPGVLATPSEQAAANNWLQNQAGMIKQQGGTPAVLMKVRENIRAKISEAPEGSARRQLLARAEETINNRLKYALPAKTLETLRETDAHYGTYKVLERAMGAAKDQPLNPKTVSAAIAQETDPGAYARGAGGELRTLASNTQRVLSQESPKTGARLMASGKYNPLPWVANWANRPGVKPFILGETAAQQRAAALINALRNKAPSMGPVSNRLPVLLAPLDEQMSYSQRAYAEMLRRMYDEDETAVR